MLAAQFTAYEVFAIISGIALIVMAMLPGLDGSSRAWSLVGGALLVGYGTYVAQQTTGTYYFPVWIFIIPFAAVLYLGISVYEWFTGGSEPKNPVQRSSATPHQTGERNTTSRSLGPATGPTSSQVGAHSPPESQIAARPRVAENPTLPGEVRLPPQPGTGHDG